MFPDPCAADNQLLLRPGLPAFAPGGVVSLAVDGFVGADFHIVGLMALEFLDCLGLGFVAFDAHRLLVFAEGFTGTAQNLVAGSLRSAGGPFRLQ